MVQVVTANKENKTKAKKAKDNTNYENSRLRVVPHFSSGTVELYYP